MSGSNYEQNKLHIAQALWLGVTVDEVDPLGPGHIDEIAAWLASENIGRLDAVSTGVDDGGE